MDNFIYQFTRFANQVGNTAHSLNRETWIVVSLTTIVIGYFLLRGESR